MELRNKGPLLLPGFSSPASNKIPRNAHTHTPPQTVSLPAADNTAIPVFTPLSKHYVCSVDVKALWLLLGAFQILVPNIIELLQ